MNRKRPFKLAGSFVAGALVGLALLFLLPASAKVPERRPAAVSDEQTEANIAQITASLLERSQYSRHPFDKEISSRFLDRYLDRLDADHLDFLQSDLKEFEVYRTNLHILTLKKHDVSPCHVIFDRFLQRLEERVSYATNLLATENFDFTGHDRYVIDRHTLPRPIDLIDAEKLWSEELRCEYLQEKLQMEETNSAGAIHLDARQQAEIRKTLAGRYERLLANYKELSGDTVFEMYLNSLAHAYDPHSDYMGHAQSERFAMQTSLSYVGIGATLRTEGGHCLVDEIMPEGPAMKSGKIKSNDRILAVAQKDAEAVDVAGMASQKVVDMIRGPKGTQVTLTLQPADASDPSQRRIITLTRDEIKLEDQAAKARIYETIGENGEPQRLGVIDLPSFYGSMDANERTSVTTDVARLLKRLKQEKVNGVILDLRHNGGGLVGEAVNLTGLFIPQGPVVQTRSPDGEVLVDADLDPSVAYDGPLVVLTSRYSASASEIMAGALQDYQRALIVGDRSTFGKGTVQAVVKLAPFLDQRHLRYNDDPGTLKLTIKKFYRAGGSSTQHRGVTADLELPSVLDHARVGEVSLPNPLPWDEVASAHPVPLDRTRPYLSSLRRRLTQRLESEPEWARVRADIEDYQKQVAGEGVSLNEAERLAQRKEEKAREEARKKEHLAHSKSSEKVYELTLQNVDLTGLQPPAPKTNSVPAAGKSGTVHPTPDSANEDALTDETLNETRRIMSDYIALLNKTLQVSEVR